MITLYIIVHKMVDKTKLGIQSV